MASDEKSQLASLLRLTLTSGLGPILVARLLEQFGDAERVRHAARSALQQVPGIGRELAARIERGPDAGAVEREIEQTAALGIALIPITSTKYPPLLRAISDAPPVLQVRGTLCDDDVYAIAVVGTRRCTAYGRDQAGRLAAGLAQQGITIVSGGARGIDTEAHRGALRAAGRTIVVLGSGLAHLYPNENAPLFDEIVEKGGAVVSEFPVDTPPVAENFPRRNRIISGLSLGTLVIEAPDRSGALITARLACEDHNREVMVLPGRADSHASTGSHKIIREGWGRLVTNVPEILESLEGAEHLVRAVRGESANLPMPLFDFDADTNATPDKTTEKEAETAASIRHHNLSDTQQKILASLESDPVELETLAATTGLPVHRLQADITILQLRGLIARTATSGITKQS